MANRAAVCLSASFILGTLSGEHGGFLFPALQLLFLLFTSVAIARGQEGAGKAILSRCLCCTLAFGLGHWHFQAETGVRDRLEAALMEGETITVQRRQARTVLIYAGRHLCACGWQRLSQLPGVCLQFSNAYPAGGYSNMYRNVCTIPNFPQ